ncbi:FAD:protein FMN transferase [Sulfurovum sp. zt1-1]|uniref:FAD:protein FMN transferase n=1 Tax=Sulfurovum zhangzhouensis TaxID=3019067 RepID=A0ABT7QXP8_9BACT|nr:FAD:protein FMN transferase [Sulfurovum zhangzhouensis]MDM5271608.1 FAD:protein FMN transferase [Sulfurovum zhangzhouensis]
MQLRIVFLLIFFLMQINIVFALDSFSEQNTSYTNTSSNNPDNSIEDKENYINRTRSLMGTYATISLSSKYNDQISSAFDLIKSIENSLSTYDPNATLAKLNKNHKVPYDDFLAESIKLSKSYYVETDGFFDITIGSISKKLYHFGEEKTYSPSKEELKKAHLNIEGIHIDQISIQSDEDIIIDLGGMGKGYAVDKTTSYLKEQNITKGIIALSGDIQCLDTCTVYLQSPYSPQTFAKITSKDKYLSISTSGPYRRYATIPEEHHLINPKTALQGNDFVSVSLITTGNNAKIDAYATAISVMPKEKAIAFLKNLDEIGFILVDAQSSIIYGKLDKFVNIEFLDYKDTATMEIISKNKKTKTNIDRSFIHPDTNNPKMIRP